MKKKEALFWLVTVLFGLAGLGIGGVFRFSPLLGGILFFAAVVGVLLLANWYAKGSS